MTPLHIRCGTVVTDNIAHAKGIFPYLYYLCNTYILFRYLVTYSLSIFQSYIMIHSYGQKILYPWSYTAVRVHDFEDLAKMGQIMARNIERVSGLDYSVGSAPRTQYLAAGGSDDWAKGEMGKHSNY